MSAREPVLNPVRIKSLRPTQMTLGLREVEEKRRMWRERGGDKGSEFLGRHVIPVVTGPKGRQYLIDHHHLARALEDEGVRDVLVNVLADLSSLAREEFWIFLDNRSWCHPYDAEGRLQPNLSLLGVLTEGVRYFTHYLPSPRSRLRAVLDAEYCVEKIVG